MNKKSASIAGIVTIDNVMWMFNITAGLEDCSELHPTNSDLVLDTHLIHTSNDTVRSTTSVCANCDSVWETVLTRYSILTTSADIKL